MRTLWLVLGLMLGAATAVAEHRLPAAAFSSAAELREPQLSPDGKRLAALVRHEGRQALVLRRLDQQPPGYRPLFTAQDPELSFRSLRWLDDGRLLLGVRDGQPMRRSDVSQDALLVVDAGSGEALNLYRGNGPAVRWNNDRDNLVDSAQADAGSLLLMGGDPALRGHEQGVYRIDTRTARRSRVAAGLYGAMRFWADRDGQVRVVLRRDGERLQLLQRADGAWAPLREWPATQQPPWFALGFGEAAHDFYVRSADQVLRLDLSRPEQAPEPVAQAPQLRRATELLRDGGRVIGAGGPGFSHYWDAQIELQRQRWAAALGAEQLTIRQAQGGRYLIASSQGEAPWRYWLGRLDSAALEPLADSRPALRELAAVERQRVDLPGLGSVTLRRQAGASRPGPLLWCLECSLEAADNAGFNALQAFLISRGFVLAAPSAGSSMNAGEWGLLPWVAEVLPRHRDAIRALRGHAWLSPQAPSLYGRDQGAYLAMRLARELGGAEVHALIVVGGLSDLAAHIARVDDRRFTEASRQAMRRLLGDASSAELRAGSPIHWAAELPERLLIVHGERDGAVHPDQGRELLAARRAQSRPAQWLKLSGANHDVSDGAERRQVLEAIEALLGDAVRAP